MGLVRNFIKFVFDIIFSAGYIIAWILLCIGVGDHRWIVFDPEYARALPDIENAQPPLSSPQLTCEAGLWQTCCPLKYWIPKTEELSDLSDSECKSLITIGTVYEPVFSGIDDFYIFQIWPIRCAMLIAVVMPFVAVISVICGNRFCGYVSMVVSGLFGLLSIGLFVYFSIQYFMLGSLPNDDPFNKYVELGPSFLCAVAGSLTIMLLTFLDCLACSRNYRKIKKIVNETTDNQMEINDIGQTERQTQQRQTMNPYEIDSEQEDW